MIDRDRRGGCANRRKMDGDRKKQLRADVGRPQHVCRWKAENLDTTERERHGELVKSRGMPGNPLVAPLTVISPKPRRSSFLAFSRLCQLHFNSSSHHSSITRDTWLFSHAVVSKLRAYTPAIRNSPNLNRQRYHSRLYRNIPRYIVSFSKIIQLK